MDKNCSKCGASKPQDQFYKMGSRVDSWCKSCKRATRRTKYVSKTDKRDFDRVINLAKFFSRKELLSIDHAISQLDKILLQ